MALRQTKSNPYGVLLLVTVLSILLLWSCGSGGSSNDSAASTGVLSFKVVFHDAARDLQSKALQIDCTGRGIATIEARVYDSNNESIADGGPWDCNAGQGTIAAVPAGDWRMPNINELQSIVDYEKNSSPSIDTTLFDHTRNSV
jgi:hypothetical protein